MKQVCLTLLLAGLSMGAYAQTATNKIDTTGNVGIGKLNPSAVFEVQGTGGNQIRTNQTGTTARYLNIWHGSSSGVIDAIGGGDLYLGYSTTTNILLNRNGGNVGIGTANPYAKLDINGSTRITGSTPPSTGQGLELYYSGGQGDLFAYDRDASAFKDLRLRGSKIILTEGNVGVGTSSPNTNLDVVGTSGDVLRISGNDATQGGTSGILFVQRDAPNDYGGAIRLVNTQANPQWLNPRLDFAVQDLSTHVLSSVSTKMSILGSGNVGIGTTNPASKLHIQGSNNTAAQVRFVNTNPATDNDWTLGAFYNDQTLRFRADGIDDIMSLKDDGKVGIGISNPSTTLELYDTTNPVLRVNNGGSASPEIAIELYRNSADNGKVRFIPGGGANAGLVLQNDRSDDSHIIFKNQASIERMRIEDNGNVGIGTANPDSKLTVAGTVKSREVIVEETAGADFVFEEDYDLPTLAEIEKFIKANKHLEGIASAEEMKKNGVKVGELQIKLLQKIEELTLHTIEQEKAKNSLKEMLKSQQELIEELTKKVDKLENEKEK